MKKTKVTIYLPDDLRRALKKHIIDTDETLSEFVERAARLAQKQDGSRAGKKRLSLRAKTAEIDDAIRDLQKTKK